MYYFLMKWTKTLVKKLILITMKLIKYLGYQEILNKAKINIEIHRSGEKLEA